MARRLLDDFTALMLPFLLQGPTNMTNADSDSLVSVYSTPLPFDAEIVKSMLADEDIPSTVENSSSPFPGLTAMPVQVFVTKENENFARRLIEEHETLHKQNVDRTFDEEAAEPSQPADEV